MSGQDAIKGFIYQTLAAVLDSLHKDWRTILIEPKEQDKIDIIWSDQDDLETVWQIKSSQNSFEKPAVLDRILEIYNSHNNAKEYRVVLIGPVNKPTTKFFNQIETKKIDDFNRRHQILFGIKEKIKVVFLQREEQVMIDAVITRLGRFLESKGKTVDISLLELITKALLFDFLKLSSIGKILPKNQFEFNLLRWVKERFPQLDKLRLAFYLTNKISFTDSFLHSRIADINDHEYVLIKKKNLLNLIEEIEGFNFSENNTSYLFFNRPVGEYERKMIECGAKKYLNVELSNSFFNFGRLEMTKSLSPFSLSYNTEYSGTNEEKAKMDLFLEFKFQLKSYHDLFRFWKKIQQFYFLPIVLVNDGNTYQEGLTIKIVFPAIVKIVIPSDFPYPKENNIIKELYQEQSVLFQNFKHFKDRNVNEYHTKKLSSENFNERLNLKRITDFCLFDETELQKERFYELLDYYFDFQVESGGQVVVECDIHELKANDAISLPSFIFFKTKEDFTVEYEINSNNLPQKVYGVLNVKAENY